MRLTITAAKKIIKIMPAVISSALKTGEEAHGCFFLNAASFSLVYCFIW